MTDKRLDDKEIDRLIADAMKEIGPLNADEIPHRLREQIRTQLAKGTTLDERIDAAIKAATRDINRR